MQWLHISVGLKLFDLFLEEHELDEGKRLLHNSAFALNTFVRGNFIFISVNGRSDEKIEVC